MPTNPYGSDVYQPLGFFLVAWNTYEEILEVGIWKISGMSPENTHIVLGSMMTYAKACVAQSLAAANLGQTEAEDIRDIIAAIHETASRNTIIHGHISKDDDHLRFGLREIKQRLRYHEQSFSAFELANQTSNLATEMGHLQEAFGITDQDFSTYRNALANLDNNAPTFPDPTARES